MQDPAAGLTVRDVPLRPGSVDESAASRNLQPKAWQWALDNRASDGTLPAGSEIARHYGRRERWGRLVKSAGLGGEFEDVI